MITMKIKAAAMYLGLSEYMVRKLCKTKQIPHIKTGGMYLFRAKSLDEWMDNQEKQNLKSVRLKDTTSSYTIAE